MAGVDYDIVCSGSKLAHQFNEITGDERPINGLMRDDRVQITWLIKKKNGDEMAIALIFR